MLDLRSKLFALTPAKAIVLIVLVGWLAYANCFTKSFLLDDHRWIVNNDELPNWVANVLSNITRPVIAFSLTFNYKLGGLHMVGYHIVNVMAHIGAALALFGIVRRTLLLPRWNGAYDASALPLALAAALIWVAHPMNTHAVTYVIQRCESFMGFFYALGLYCVIRGAATSSMPIAWYAGAVASAWLGIGCKEVIATIAPVVLIYDRLFLANSWGELIRKRWYLYLGLASNVLFPVYIHFRPAFVATGDQASRDVGLSIPGLPPIPYLYTETGVIWHYLWLTVWPLNLCFEYRDWPVTRTLSGAALTGLPLLGVFLITAYGLVRRNGFAFLGAAFFLTLGVTSSFLPLLDVANEYRMYVPLMAISAGVVIGGAMVFDRILKDDVARQIVPIATLAVVVAALLFVTHRRNEDYRTPLSIWEDVLAKRPEDYKVYNHIGVAYEFEAKWDEAKKYHRKCLEYQPENLFALTSLGLIEYREGNAKDALGHLSFIYNKITKTQVEATTIFGTFLHLEGDSDSATIALDLGQKIAGSFGLPHFLYAQVLEDYAHDLDDRAAILNGLGQPLPALVAQAKAAVARDKARVDLDRAAKHFPEWPKKFPLFAQARLRGRFGDAMTVRKEALFYAKLGVATAPEKTPEVLVTLADAYAWAGRYDDALVPLREAIVLAKDRPAEYRRQLDERRRQWEMNSTNKVASNR